MDKTISVGQRNKGFWSECKYKATLRKTMNWYSVSKIDKAKVLFAQSYRFDKISTKLAYSTRAHQTDIARQNSDDGATCKVQMTESRNKISLGVTFNTDIYAFPLFEETWLYPTSEMKRAIKTYNRIVNVIEDLKTDAEEEELPMPSIQGKAREELRFIDIDRKKPAISTAQKAARYETGASDWRNSIYGNRYPQPTVVINNENGTINLQNG